MENKLHWENVYQTKLPNEVSWTQEVPKTSLDFISQFDLPKTACIIDVGGGDSRLVDYLLEQGYENITVLDISSKALERAQARLGAAAAKVNWVAMDITAFQSEVEFDLWHDRATFHFLTTDDQINKYLSIVRQNVKPGRYAVMGTFSTDGPEKCSGLPIKQYNEESLTKQLLNGFEKVKCITEDHITPFNTKQNFLFCSFRRN